MKPTFRILFSLLRSPLLIGAALSTAFYIAVRFWPIDHWVINDYFAGHPIEYVTTTLFLVGLASLANKAIDTWWSWSYLSRSQAALNRVFSAALNPNGSLDHPSVSLMSEPDMILELPECGKIVEHLDGVVAAYPADKVTRRVRDVLDRMVRGGSVDHLDDELRYASEAEADRLYEEYTLFRVVVWAVPILGFLGTVVGITMAIANLSPQAMEQSLPLVVSSLSVAFATTIQALSLSIVLMFTKYPVSQLENRLSSAVDQATERILLGRFQSFDDSPDGQLSAVRHMAETVVRASEQLVRQQAQISEELTRRQAELWQKSMEASEQRWAHVTATAGKQLETALVAALSQSMKIHAEELSKNETIAAKRNQEHWNHVTAGLQKTTASTTALEESVERQVLVLQKTVEATGQVTRLEEALNRNLSALANAKQLEQVATSLSAAIHLLIGRLSETSDCNIQLESPKESSSAA